MNSSVKEARQIKHRETHLFRVSTKEMDVVLYPLQRHPLVKEADIPRSLGGAVQSQEAESTDPVVHRNHNDCLAVS